MSAEFFGLPYLVIMNWPVDDYRDWYTDSFMWRLEFQDEDNQ